LFDHCNTYIYKLVKLLANHPDADSDFVNWQLTSKLAYAHYIMVTRGDVVEHIVTVDEILVV
jgi:hypothetical protein